MPTPDIEYLRRIQARASPAALLKEPAFLVAQDLFFSVVGELGGEVDFDIADMREVHAVAALGGVKGLRVLDVGCGATGEYVLEETFRDRYPPFFAEMLARRGAAVTGVDIRPNPDAGYDHRVLDCTKADWASGLDGPYDIVACLSLFNAPGSPFERDAALCDRVLGEMRGLVKPDGLIIVTLRDEMPGDGERVRAYVQTQGLQVLHVDGNCAWLRVPGVPV
jgi:2-polyprenyl-3-methyl-5-hydroxy-6-metoxy-1,4-benzoquinol methylase